MHFKRQCAYINTCACILSKPVSFKSFGISYCIASYLEMYSYFFKFKCSAYCLYLFVLSFYVLVSIFSVMLGLPGLNQY